MKPLIFLGSNSNIILFAETAEKMSIPVHGILDSNYYGNTQDRDGIPFVGSEDSFNFSDDFVYFVSPSVVPTNAHDRQKRLKMIDIVERLNLPLQTLVNKNCEVARTATLEPGAYVGYGCCIGHGCVLKSHSQVHSLAGFAHHSVLGKNSVMERGAQATSYIVIGDNVHIAFGAALTRDGGLTVGNNAIIHPKVTVMRDVEENEIVSLAGDNKRRIYGEVVRV